MDEERRREIRQGCTRYLRGHYPRNVRKQLLAVAESEYAELPPDNYGHFGYATEFEKEIAELLGKPAAVFMPSGTMAQQIALRIWSDRSNNMRIAFHPTCHLEIHEQNAYRVLHGLEGVLLGEKDRLFTLYDLQQVTEDLSTLLIELPQREIGGQLPTPSELQEILSYAHSRGWKLHMDGARLWETQPYFGKSYAEICAPFDSVYCSFYKILDGLPGAALAGPEDFVAEARVWLRRHGGNLHQQSPSVIAAKLGLEKHLPRIHEYVAKAAEIAGVLRELPGIRLVPEHPPTNMMHVYFHGSQEEILDRAYAAAERTGIWGFSLGATADPMWQKYELSVGEAALDISNVEIREWFSVVANGKEHQ